MTLRVRHRAAVRLRPEPARHATSRTAAWSSDRRRDADPARGARARRRAAGARAQIDDGRRARLGHADGGAGARGGARVGRRRARRGRSGWPSSSGCSTRPCAFWRAWLAQSTYTGRWREMLERSAITLKLMTYAPTGGLVAAPTRGCPSRSAASATGTTATPGSATPRSPCTRCSAWGSPRRRAQFGAGCATGSASAPARAGGPLNIMYRVDGTSDLQGGDPRALVGLPRFAPGADRQRRRRASCSSTSTARRWTASTSPTRTASRSGTAGWTATGQLLDWLAEQLGPARRGHLGDPRRPQGLHLRPAHVLGGVRPGIRLATVHGRGRPRSSGGPRRATPSTSRSWRAAGTPRSRRSCSTTAPTCSTRRCCGWRRVGFIAPTTRCGCRRCARWTPSWSPTASSTATTPSASPDGLQGSEGTFSLCTLHVRRRAGPRRPRSTRPGSPSRRCSPTPTTSGCTPRRSA